MTRSKDSQNLADREAGVGAQREATARDDSGGVFQLMGALITLGLLALIGGACVALFIYDTKGPLSLTTSASSNG